MGHTGTPNSWPLFRFYFGPPGGTLHWGSDELLKLSKCHIMRGTCECSLLFPFAVMSKALFHPSSNVVALSSQSSFLGISGCCRPRVALAWPARPHHLTLMLRRHAGLLPVLLAAGGKALMYFSNAFCPPPLFPRALATLAAGAHGVARNSWR